MSVCLAVTCHDPAGAFVPGIEQAGTTVAKVFHSVAVNATAQSSDRTLTALRTAAPALREKAHEAGAVGIGVARRDALALALQSDATHIAYSDLDHVLRWASSDPAELSEAMTPQADVDLTIIGRSEQAFAREPERLQSTEGVVNHTASLLLGPEVIGGEPWDFMIAMRLMTRACAELIVEHSTEESIANDVAWPLLVHQYGNVLGYVAVDGLAYRFRDDFGAAGDARDTEPGEWIRRLEIAAQHASAMRRFL